MRRVAVLGAGVMGAGIAALIASSGIEVLLYDRAMPEGSRNQLAEQAIIRLVKQNILLDPSHARHMIPANFEDDLGRFAEVDWVIEVVIEDLVVKQKLYRQIHAHMAPSTIVSSNTSTLPLAQLIAGMPDSFRKQFLITHFFNPPRHMPLLELVTSTENDPAMIERIHQFMEVSLGKEIIVCKDTPGFIANRIGCYFLELALREGIQGGLTVEAIDAWCYKQLGLPGTAVCGLFDLIGLDLMPHIAQAMLDLLPAEDAFVRMYQPIEWLEQMVKEGYTGRKGKGGFYRMVINPDGSKKKEVYDYAAKAYRAPLKAQNTPTMLAECLSAPGKEGIFIRRVVAQTIDYAASLVPTISDRLCDIDAAMRYGYGWKYGPFEWLDQLATPTKSGAAYMLELMATEGLTASPQLTALAAQRCYKDQHYYDFITQRYQPIPLPQGAITLASLLHQPDIFAEGRLWVNHKHAVVCLELTTKMHTLHEAVFALIQRAVDLAEAEGFPLLLVAETSYFSAGADLIRMLKMIEAKDYQGIESFLVAGQHATARLKYAKIPTVAVAQGVAVGGGCELLMHMTATQSHTELVAGLVETQIGVIPAWGGCKEAVIAAITAPDATAALVEAYRNIMLNRRSHSFYQAKSWRYLRDTSRMSMHRRYLITDAIALCATLHKNYTPPLPQTITLLPAAQEALTAAYTNLMQDNALDACRQKIAGRLLTLFAGNGQARSEQELLDQERTLFMELIDAPEVATLIRKVVS
jgi:3-hydroxyacyl-CoA dehydrogenase